MTEIRLAGRGDLPELKNIWRVCFGDPDEYVDFFYGECFERIETLVRTIDGRPVSMIHLLRAELVSGERKQEAKLIYAAGTHPDYRLKGHMAALLAFAKTEAKKTGCALFLKPSNEKLLNYYEKYGFKKDADFRIFTAEAGGIIPLETRSLTAKEYNELRDEAFRDKPYVRWSGAHVEQCVKDNAFFGGSALRLEFDGKRRFVMAYPKGDTLVITETDMSPREIRQSGGALCESFGCRKIKAYLPEYAGEGERLTSSAVFGGEIKDVYVNLILI